MARPSYTKVTRPVLFGPGIIAAPAAWASWHEPMRMAGLGVLLVAGLVTWPLLVILLVFGIPALLLALIPRPWRKRYFHAKGPVKIPEWFRRIVLAADRHRCSACRRPVYGRMAHVDHFFPRSLGGCRTLLNCFTLCGYCNIIKSNAWVFRGRFWSGASRDPARARWVLECERIHRYNLLRWLRAAWAIGA